MKTKVKTSDISRGLKACVNATDVKDDIRKCIQFEAENDSLKISASNSLYSIYFSCNATVDDEGMAVVDGRTVYNVIAKATDNCSFTANDRSMIVNARGKTTIPNINREIPFPEESDGKNVTCDSVDFKNAVNKILYAISEDQSRVILTGAHFVTDGNFATLTALDGFRMAQTTFACEGDVVDVIIPARVLSDVCDTIVSGALNICAGNTRISFAHNEFRFNSALLAGSYIDTNRLLPKDFAVKVLAKTSDIKDMIDSATIASGKSNLVKLQFANDKITFSSNSESATFQGDIDAMIDGTDVDIAFNLRYLSNAVNHISTEQCVIRMNSSVAPAIIVPHAENTVPDIHLILPVRIFG